ncbi:GNAT family N-acetyltransferase [bacterium]|nr:GNAT family N-acetyltransferase [bacterium]
MAEIGSRRRSFDWQDTLRQLPKNEHQHGVLGSEICDNLKMQNLESKRLRFRPFAAADLAEFWSLDTDPEVVRYLGGKIKTQEQCRERLELIAGHHREHGHGLCFTQLKTTGEFVGRTGLIPWELDGEKLWEVGYTFARKYWGQGLASEASAFWISHGFAGLPVEFLVSLIHPENAASIRVAEKNGMQLWKQTEIKGLRINAYRINR